MPRPEPAKPVPPGGERQAFRVSETVRERISGHAVLIRVPADMRALAIDFLRDAGGTVVDALRAERTLAATERQEQTFSGMTRNKLVLEVEFLLRNPDDSTQIVMRGRGEEVYQGYDRTQAIASAAKKALDDLSRLKPFPVSQDVAELIADRTVAFSVPAELRAMTIDFVLAAKGVPIESSRTDWRLNAQSRTVQVFTGIVRQKLVLDMELVRTSHDQSSRVVLLRGQGEELIEGHDVAQAIVTAGRRAFDRLAR